MDIRKYIYGHCISPVRVRVFDARTNSHVWQSVPCGKCLHCRNTLINEWCTRLQAQFQDSQYCYYVSLDYRPFDSSSVARKLAAETAACIHNLNINHKFGLQPLVLCKSHLQNFFKRLRKNTGLKLQYFACGEYGTHAEGKGYGRPHFHTIIFSNNPISESDFVQAWTINKYQIGRVDFQDLKFDCMVGKSDIKTVVRYVAKYLQKIDFDFEKLRTIAFHRAYFKSLQYEYDKLDTLFPEMVEITDKSRLEFNWDQYIKQYSPFVVCSKRPAIGYSYLSRNIARFKTGDFRLFGLESKDTAFPRYFLRKAKEDSCSYVCVSPITEKPTTSASILYVVSLLDSINTRRVDFSFASVASSDSQGLCTSDKILSYEFDRRINPKELNVYDVKNHVFYQFSGEYYTLWHKYNNIGYTRFGYMDLATAASNFSKGFLPIYENFVLPFGEKRILNENELYDTIDKLYLGADFEEKYSRFREEVYARYRVEIDSNRRKKILSQNSKNTL